MNLTEYLTTPAPAQLISWKIQSANKDKTQGTLVSYLDGQYYENRLDEGVTQGVLESWDEVTEVLGLVGNEMVARCILTLTTPDGKSIKRTGVGAAPSGGGSTASLAKTAATDAFKRACARAGLGRFLYDLPQPVIPLEGGRYQTKESKAQMPAYTKALMDAYLAGASSEELERGFKWALKDGKPFQAPRQTGGSAELSKAIQFVERAAEDARKAGKQDGVEAALRANANWRKSLDDARKVYKSLTALVAN